MTIFNRDVFEPFHISYLLTHISLFNELFSNLRFTRYIVLYYFFIVLDDSAKEKGYKDTARLPAYRWSEVYRALKPFLRPFGDSGEGRLDFYHRSLSKAVRKK